MLRRGPEPCGDCKVTGPFKATLIAMKDLDSIIFASTVYVAWAGIIDGRWPQSTIAAAVFLAWNYKAALRRW